MMSSKQLKYWNIKVTMKVALFVTLKSINGFRVFGKVS